MILFIVAAMIGSCVGAIAQDQPPVKVKPFSLSPAELHDLPTKSNRYITIHDLTHWDVAVNELTSKKHLDPDIYNRLIAYLYNAQAAFANASYLLTGAYSGNLDAVSLHVLQLFYPDFKYKAAAEKPDPFSEELAKQLAKQIDERFKAEQAQIHPVTIRKGPDLWQEDGNAVGIDAPSMMLWVINDLNEFKCPQPPPPMDPFWQQQLAEVKAMMRSTTEAQLKSIHFWAGMAGPGSGSWIKIAEKYMADHNTPVKKRIAVRSMLATAIFDAIVAGFNSKYLYMVRRPYMLDKDLKTVIPTPKHPSYPANHAVSSAAASLVLSYYFQENQQQWNTLAKECNLSRIRAGIHFPIDLKEGSDLGSKVGKYILTNFQP